MVPEVLARKIKQLKEIKGIQFRKEEVNVLLFAGDMTLHISDSKILSEVPTADKYLK